MFCTRLGWTSTQSLRTWAPRLSTKNIHLSSFRYSPHIPVHSSKPVTSFRLATLRATPVGSFTKSKALLRPSVSAQIMFVVFGSLGAFWWAEETSMAETLQWVQKVSKTTRNPTVAEVFRARQVALAKTLQDGVTIMQEYSQFLPLYVRALVVKTYVKLAQSYLDAPEGRRVSWMLNGVFALVFVAFSIKRLRPMMNAAFQHDPLSGRSYTLFTSMFSHPTLLHLVFNSLALAGFGTTAATYLRQKDLDYHVPQANSMWHFLAFFVSAGLFSGLTYHLVAVRFIYPRIIKSQLAANAITVPAFAKAAAAATTPAAARKILPTVGASGAIYACVTLSALAFPQAELSPTFPPIFTVSIQTGVGAMVLLDIIGAIRGWRYLNHWAHLGGAAYGVLYYYYGPAIWALIQILMVDASTAQQKERQNQ